ncbi:MAG TPA: ribonuclease E activity regulator RraA [Ignavibacteria bacterium]|nr:ribonuclease E activity regulator RraA [Ignavibacteria bacterium]
MNLKTTDLCDNFSDKIQIAEPAVFTDFGGRKIFSGKIHTIKCFENNPLVRTALEGNGEGKVLIVDGGASVKCALLGDMLGEIAVKNKWSGIIVNGCIRDSAALGELDLGVKALCAFPLKSGKKNEGQENVPVRFAGIDFNPGEFIYCDEDGVIVSKDELMLE